MRRPFISNRTTATLYCRLFAFCTCILNRIYNFVFCIKIVLNCILHLYLKYIYNKNGTACKRTRNSEHFGLYKHSPIPLYGKLEVHSVERMYLRQRCPTAVASLVCGLRHFRRITKIILLISA